MARGVLEGRCGGRVAGGEACGKAGMAVGVQVVRRVGSGWVGEFRGGGGEVLY